MPEQKRESSGRRLHDNIFVRIAHVAAGAFIASVVDMEQVATKFVGFSIDFAEWIHSILTALGGTAAVVSIGTLIFSIPRWVKDRKKK